MIKITPEKYLIWHIQGGLGKNVAASALCATLRQKYEDRKIIIVNSYPEIFLNNPYVDKVYELNVNPHFYENYIFNKDVLIFKHEPYNQTGHILKTKHLIENWCDLLQIPYENQHPQLFPNYAQKINVQKWLRSKPSIVLNTCGGPQNSLDYYNWARDMPQEIANLIVEKYKNIYHIFHITRMGGYKLDNVERIDYAIPAMELFGLLINSSKRFLIDSCLQHAACAVKMPSVVFWIATSPKVFGYSIHDNIQAYEKEPKNNLILSYTFDYQFTNNLHECPYNTLDEMFDLGKVQSII